MYIFWHNYILKLGFTLMHQIGCLSNEISPGQRICCSFRRADHLLPTYRGVSWGRGGSRFLLTVSERGWIGNKLFLTCQHYFPNNFYHFYSSVGWEERKGGGRGRGGGRGMREKKECSVVPMLNFCWGIFIVVKGALHLSICKCSMASVILHYTSYINRFINLLLL